MRKSAIILPFLGVFCGAIAVALRATYGEIPWLASVIGLIGSMMFPLWFILDFRGFARIFSRQGLKYGLSSGLAVLLGCGVIFGLAYASSLPRFNKSIDLTQNMTNTLADQTTKLIKKISAHKEPLIIVAFFTDDTQKRRFQELLYMYEMAGLSVQKSFIDPQTSPAQAIGQNITSPNLVIVKYGDQQARFTSFTEEKLTNAILNVIKGSSKKIYFSSGHGEGSIDSQDTEGYSAALEQLKENKFQINQLDFFEKGGIPGDASLVIVGGPQYDLKESEISLFKDYLARGGALLLMVDALVPVRYINKLVASQGLIYEDNLLILKSDDSRSKLLGQNNSICSHFDEFHPITKDFGKQTTVATVVPNSRSVAKIPIDGVSSKSSVIVKTSNVVVAITGVKTKEELQRIAGSQVKEGEFGCVAVSQTPIITKKGPGENRLVLVGSSYLANNLGFQRAENFDFFMNIVNYLTTNEDYIAIPAKRARTSELDLSGASSQLSLLIIAFIYPFFFLGAGFWYWLRRRRA